MEMTHPLRINISSSARWVKPDQEEGSCPVKLQLPRLRKRREGALPFVAVTTVDPGRN